MRGSWGVRWWALGLTLSLTAGCSGDSGSDGPAGPSSPSQVARLELAAPDTTLVAFGQEVQIALTAFDATGTVVQAGGIRWVTDGSSAVQLSGAGVAIARANGTTTITASSGSVSASIELIVAQAVDSVALSGLDTLFTVGIRRAYSVEAFDPLGSPYVRTPPTWSTSDPTVATVDAGGRVTGLTAGTVELRVSIAGVQAARSVAIVPEIPLEIDPALAETFQALLEDSAGFYGIVGASAAIRIPGQGLWQGVIGHSHETVRLRPHMALFIGSIVKTYVAGIIGVLVDDGVLDFDDTMGQQLPALANVAPEITVRQALQNTAGLYSFTSHPSLFDSILADPSRVWTPLELAERFILAPPAAPGSPYTSSNSGYLLSGMVAETVEGAPIHQLYRTRMFTPLGLSEAYMPGFEAPTTTESVTWFGPLGGPLVNYTETFASPSIHTALYPLVSTSARHLAAWGEALFTSFHSPQTRSQIMTAVPDDGLIPGQNGAGLGVRRYNHFGRVQWGHTGAAGNGGGYLIHDVDSGITIAVLYNANPASHRQSHFVLVPRLLDAALRGVGAR